MKWIEFVGRRFRAFGGIYECMEYTREAGFRMRLVGGTDGLLNRTLGDETWVSERALGRTYHDVYDFEDAQ